MNQQSSAESAMALRFNEYVGSHAERALEWYVQADRQGETPYRRVEFVVLDREFNYTDPDSPTVHGFFMRAFVELSPEEREKYGPRAPIVADWIVDKGFTVVDACDKLNELTGVGESPRRPSVMAGLLINKIQELEDNDLLVPAGLRRFPF